RLFGFETALKPLTVISTLRCKNSEFKILSASDVSSDIVVIVSILNSLFLHRKVDITVRGYFKTE
ncbi:MAG: hypothetical protein AAF327_23670, partial [Cyanobacteria bacterium P01_A01_bin.37]